MRHRLHRASRDDEGLTLVELIIYMSLTVVVGTIVVSMFISTIQTQERVTAVTQATTRGQVVAQSIEKALRNAVDVSIEGTNGDTLKVLTTLSGAGTCQAWRVTSAGTLQVSTGAGFTSWGDMATNVVTLSGARFFAQDATRIAYSLGFDADGRTVDFTGAVASRTPGGSVSATCS